MKEIKLTQGKVTQVNDEDFEWLNQFRWCAAKNHRVFYAVRRIRLIRNGLRQLTVHMHRMILNAPKGVRCDHKDCNGLNNQRYNIRICTASENVRNTRKQIRQCSSKFKGVFYRKDQYG